MPESTVVTELKAVNSVKMAIQTRFASVLDDKDALLAAVSCPKFKLAE